MRVFTPLYTRTMAWARHPHASRYLAALSFAESSFFPVPPDVMLAPMAMAQPGQALRLALLTTVASVLGGVAGYGIGWWGWELLRPWVEGAGLGEAYTKAQAWFSAYGVWAVVVAGFSPIPYKAFTIAAGALQMALMPFVVASLVGRGARFFLVALLMAWGGARLEKQLYQWIEGLGWAAVGILGLIVALRAWG
ncbi:MAG: DedA family protein [Hydrogenophilus sp.]|nr:DedA family protein [Hydrogenophilus sp.]